MLRLMRTHWLSYGVASLTVALASGLTLLLRLYVEPVDLALFYAAVTVSAWWGGIRAGVLATLLSTLSIVYFSLSPVYTPRTGHSGELFSVGVFVLVTLLIGSLNSELTLAKRWARTNLKAAADTLRQSEAQLRQSNERFELAAAAVNCLIYDWNVETDRVERTEGLTRLFGYALAEAEPTRAWWETRIHPADLANMPGFDAVVLSQSDRFACEYRVRHQDGHYVHVFDQGILVRDDSGRPIRVVGSTIDISDRKQAAQRLEQANQTLRTLIDACPLAITFFDPQGIVKLWNRGAEQIFGWTAEEAVGQFLPAAPHRQEFLDNLTAVLNGQPLVGFEAERRRKNGQPIDIAVWATLIHDAEGEAGCLTIVADISDRKRAEAALRHSETRYRTLANAIPLLVWVNTADGKIEYCNDRWQTYVGMMPAANQQVDWATIIHPDDLPLVLNARQRGLDTGEPYEVECRVKRLADQSYRWHLARVVPLKDDQAQVLRWFGTAADIDSIKQAEAGQRFLAEASSVLAASLDYQTTLSRVAQLAVPFLADYCFFEVITADHQVERVAWRYVNPAKQAWFNQVQVLMSPLAVEQHPMAVAIASGQSVWVADVTEAWMRASSTSPEQLQFMHDCQLQSLIAVPLIAHQRRLGLLTFCCNSESNRRYTATDLALAQELAHRAALALDNARLYQQAQDANRMKDQFLAILSHELRSPLNPILGWAKLLQTRSLEPAVLMRGLQTIERNAKLQTQLIEDLLDISRILRGKLSLTIGTVDLKAVVEAAIETVRLAAEAKSIALQFTVENQSPALPVSGDANRLQQVVWNLLANAIKFTPSGGRVEIQLRRVEAASDSAAQPLPQAEIRITDTGKGIKPEFLPYIFDYFRQEDGATTRKFGGLGLGLAIVRHLVELHGGSVEATSPGEDQGATFMVRLALQKPDTGDRQAEAATRPAHPSRPLQALQILVVDDEPDARDLLVFLLEQAGAAVRSASSASEALQTLRESAFDLLVSDIGMPVTDGYRLMQQVRTQLPDGRRQVPAIALTAYAGELNQQQALAAGFQQHLAKPVDPDQLIQSILSLANAQEQ